MIRLFILLIATALAGACEQTFNLTSPAAPSPGSTTITNTNDNNNTNTATNNPDRTGSDTGAAQNPNDPNSVIPLPSYGESVVRGVASSNPTLLANSCQETHGESAWAFLDLAIRTLQAKDTRWGYLCKNSECSAIARDIVAYRASSNNMGIWIVDVIGNHCPLTGEIPEVRWGVLPFETTRPWIGLRR